MHMLFGSQSKGSASEAACISKIKQKIALLLLIILFILCTVANGNDGRKIINYNDILSLFRKLHTLDPSGVLDYVERQCYVKILLMLFYYY